MTGEVGKPSHSGEEVLALKRYIQKSGTDQERLRDTLGRNKDKDDFLMAHRFETPPEDFEVAMKAYEWPRKMTDIMRDANAKVGGRAGLMSDGRWG